MSSRASSSVVVELLTKLAYNAKTMNIITAVSTAVAGTTPTKISKAVRDCEANQHPPAFYSPVVRDTITKICQLETPENSQTYNTKESVNGRRNMVILQYRGRSSDSLAKKLRAIIEGISTVSTTQKLKTCLPSLKNPIPESRCSRVVYKLICSECQSCYVGQTNRHLQTRLQEHMSASAHVGAHLREYGANMGMNVKVIDRSFDENKLLTLEALHIAKLKPALNTREEYPQRQLKLQL